MTEEAVSRGVNSRLKNVTVSEIIARTTTLLVVKIVPALAFHGLLMIRKVISEQEWKGEREISGRNGNLSSFRREAASVGESRFSARHQDPPCNLEPEAAIAICRGDS